MNTKTRAGWGSPRRRTPVGRIGRDRGGFSLVGVLVLTGALGTLSAGFIHLVRGNSRAGMDLEARTRAVLAAQQIMETYWYAVGSAPDSEGEHVIDVNPELKAVLSFEPAEGFPGLRAVTVQVSWVGPGSSRRSVTLERLSPIRGADRLDLASGPGRATTGGGPAERRPDGSSRGRS